MPAGKFSLLAMSPQYYGYADQGSNQTPCVIVLPLEAALPKSAKIELECFSRN